MPLNLRSRRATVRAMADRMSIPIDPELHKRLKLQCVQLDRPMAEVINELIRAWVEAQEKRNKKRRR